MARPSFEVTWRDLEPRLRIAACRMQKADRDELLNGFAFQLWVRMISGQYDQHDPDYLLFHLQRMFKFRITDFYRKRRRYENSLVRYAEELNNDHPQMHTRVQEREGWNHLDDDQRQVVTMVEAGLNQRQMAGLLNVSAATISRRMTAAAATLARHHQP